MELVFKAAKLVALASRAAVMLQRRCVQSRRYTHTVVMLLLRIRGL
jgi:hypothetical protein